jgi:predicted tellurium resistance membrane protein TerC
MDWLTDPQIWIALLTLTALEIVLGIDNIIFISILAGKLPAGQQARARRLGLAAAMVMRILLLLSIAWVIRLTAPLFTTLGQEISGRDLILLVGGLFLLGKATFEIHDNLEGEKGHAAKKVAASFAAVIILFANPRLYCMAHTFTPTVTRSQAGPTNLTHDPS